jgi:hypothetical protein
MTTPQITIYNAITGEIVTRDFNKTELAQLETDQAQAEKDAKAKAKAEQVLAAKRQTILDRLGLTADEFTALLG